MESVTNKGKDCFVYFGNKYMRYRTKKDGVESWHCTVKTCKECMETLNTDVVSDVGLHSHDDKVNNLSVVIVRAACKREATQSIKERPAKLISCRSRKRR